jgi:hypothetical protein
MMPYALKVVGLHIREDACAAPVRPYSRNEADDRPEERI